MLPVKWKKDRDVILAALRNNSVIFLALPASLQNDREFLLRAVKENSAVWRYLPLAFRNDSSFARNIVSFRDGRLVLEVFDMLPSLQSERDMWKAVVNSAADHNFQLESYIPHEIRSDRSHEVQLLYPDLVANTFQVYGAYCGEEYEDLASRLAPELWNKRAVLKAWCFVGGPFVENCFPDSLKDDKEMFLWIAEYCEGEYCEISFESASPALLGDKEFMLQAVEHYPGLFEQAPFALRQDYDLGLAAFGSRRDLVVPIYLRPKPGTVL